MRFRKTLKIDARAAYDFPVYGSAEAAGMDVFASNNENMIIKPGDRALIPTGLKFEIPKGYELQVRPRSGLSLKHGLSVLNSPGTIDSDYRGFVGIILINHGDKQFKVRRGDKIAQLVLMKLPKQPRFKSWAVKDNTERGSGGFGSTGLTSKK